MTIIPTEKPEKKKRTPDEIRADVGQKPLEQFKELCEEPEQLIQCLDYYGGSVDDLLEFFVGKEESLEPLKLQLLAHALFILAKPENGEYRQQWTELLEAHEAAKVQMARIKAFKFIAEFNPKSNKEDLTKVSAFLRFWLASHQAAATTTARANAAQAAKPVVTGSVQLDELLKRMAETELQNADLDY